jgi:hypothetical protein
MKAVSLPVVYANLLATNLLADFPVADSDV